MKRGLQSLLFGVHQLLWHPIVVTLAWRRLYKSWPSWKELVCIVIHDWGYYNKDEMDSPDGELHPFTGAILANFLFGENYGELVLYHSRFLAKRFRKEPSKLCWPDKFSITLEPPWFYLFRARWTGELAEYRLSSARRVDIFTPDLSDREWFDLIVEYTRAQTLESILAQEDKAQW